MKTGDTNWTYNPKEKIKLNKRETKMAARLSENNRSNFE